MAHDEILSNGLTYVQNLANVAVKLNTSATPWQGTIDDMVSALGGNASLLNTFFQSFNKTTNPLPTTFNNFVQAYHNYVAANGGTNNFLFFQDSTSEYAAWVSGLTSDWDSIVPRPTSTEIANQAVAWFDHFLSTFKYKPDNTVAATASEFFGVATSQLLVTAGLREGTNLNVMLPSGFDQTSIPRYQTVYEALFPGGNFSNRLSEFYADQIADHGYFVPSQAFSEWVQELQGEYVIAIGLRPFEETSLVSGNFERTIILNRIFVLIRTMLDTLQRTAAAQANRLVILSRWQQAYTDSLNQLKVFVQGDGTPAGAATDAGKFVRGELNNTINTNLRTKLQANQQLIADTAKSLQSSISQSNDAVSAQSNMATSIIQELTTILNSIYH